MEMLGNRRLGVTQQQAWEALNDPETLKKCIPGCDKFELTGDNTYSVALAVKIGPVSAKFSGKVMLSDIVAPDGYKLTFEGQGGVAGFAKGASSVTLRPLGAANGAAGASPAVDTSTAVAAAPAVPMDASIAHEAEAASSPAAASSDAAPAAGCELDYTVQAQVGGKIAQLGQRLIDGAAKSTADDFFKRFEAEMQSRYGPPPAAAVEAAEAPAEKTGVMSGLMKKIGLGKKDDSKDAPASSGDAS
ncbi:carbon monoxide dehydrogenase [Variovorax sp. KBW07]|uniref:CoxG family protein n=1 Tax=Variovorax sp. KBW07 TaxID=2153358 RepID=UPI000F5888FF|nr:carbon monoxide dehydrogenase subunit G [Variovorax sp. KBW07]RQO57097.1 carbon monoxide dehydrogenase [Variovorax sp. KBW07]